MNNQIIILNQNTKLALTKSKNILDITNKLLSNKTTQELIESFKNFRLSVTWGHREEILSVAITPCGKNIVSGGSDATIKLWDLATGKEIKTFKEHDRKITSIAITPDGRYIVSSDNGEDIKLLDIETGKAIRTFEWHGYGINEVTITPDGKYIVSCNDSVDYQVGGTIKLWDKATGKEIKTFIGHSSFILSLAITSDGKYVVSGSYGEIKLWDINSGNELRTFKINDDGAVTSLAITRDMKYIVSCECSSCDDFFKTSGIIRLWDILTGKEIKTFKGHSEGVTSISITSDDKYIVSGSNDTTIKLWDILTGKEIKTFKGHSEGVTSISITSDDKYIVSGSWDETIKLWNIETGREVRTFSGNIAMTTKVEVTAEGKYVSKYKNQNNAIKADFVQFYDGEWIAWTTDGYYNCSDGAYKYFCFVDDSKNMPEVVKENHPIYKYKKKENLLSDSKDRRKIAGVLEYDISDDEIPF